MKNLTISGNLTKDAELRTATSGTNVANFSVAVNDRRTKQALYFDCSFWGQGGKAVAPYLKKGNSICATGEFGTREYNNKTYLTLNVSSLDLTGGRGNGRGEGSFEPTDETQVQNPNDLNYEIDDEIPF